MTGRWRDKAVCLEHDPEMFFPDPSDKLTTIAAKLICQTCPVRSECFAYALPLPGLEGIWGATTPRQRQRMRAET